MAEDELQRRLTALEARLDAVDHTLNSMEERSEATNETMRTCIRELSELIRGTPDNPDFGLLPRLRHWDRMFFGEQENWGVKQKVDIMWKSWIWLLCTGSAVGGSFLTWVILQLASQA